MGGKRVVMSDYECFADSSLFHMALKDIPKEVRRLIPERGLACEGTGITSASCAGCPFGQQQYTEEWFDSAYEDEDVLNFGQG